jgi:hypothetical protein
MPASPLAAASLLLLLVLMLATPSPAAAGGWFFGLGSSASSSKQHTDAATTTSSVQDGMRAKHHPDHHPDSWQPSHGEITSLPGFSGPLPSRHFGGYVSVGKSRQLYYYLVESERSLKDDPVV